MDQSFGKTCRRALLFACCMTLSLALLPLLAQQSASFLGKDVSQLAAGVISFYPWTAVAEGALIFSVALAIAWLFGLLAATAATVVPRGKWLLFPGSLILAYALWLLGTVLKYPALFEGSLPVSAQRLIFRLAFILSPTALFGAAAAVIAMVVACLAVVRAPAPYIKRWRWGLLVGAMAALLLYFTPLSTPPRAVTEDPKGPSVLVIGADSLRYDRLSRPEVTPALQALLADPQTVRFDDHYVGVPRTFPSWVEMLQGEYAARTGIRHMFPGFASRDKVFPGWVSSLQAAGYHTSVWSDFAGDIFPRFAAGFDEVHAPKLTLMTMIRLSVDQAFAGFLPFMTTGPSRALFPALKESPAFGDAEHLGADVRQRLSSISASSPWLETLFFSTAHFPYAAPHPYYTTFANAAYAGAFRFQKNPDLSAGDDTASSDDIAQVRALYDGAVLSIDTEISRLFAVLKARGLWDSTLIIITADHGEDLFERDHLQGHGEHLRGERVLKVPLLMKLPGHLKPAVHQVAATTRSIDLAATILAICGKPAPFRDSVNLLPYLLGTEPTPPTSAAYSETGLWFARGGTAFFQHERLDYPGISGLLDFDQGYSGEITLNPTYQQIVVTAKHRSWIDGDFKLIYMPTPRGIVYELYNRRADPENVADLAAKEPAKVAELAAKLEHFISTHEGNDQRLLNGYLVPR